MTSRILAVLLIFAGGLSAEQHRQLALQHYAAEEYERAQRAFERALLENPENSELNLWVGLAIGRRVQTMSAFRRLGAMPLVARVKRQFEKAVALDGSNIDALDALMGFLLEAPGIVGGSKRDARGVAERIQAVSSAHGAYALGIWHEEVGEIEQACKQFELARERAPDNSSYLVAHAAVLARRGSQAESDDLVEPALAREPENPAVWLAAAKAWIGARRKSLYPRAKQLAERYLASPDRDPNGTPLFEVRALLKRVPR
ncbi:MAG: hypothetical protein F4173_18100 [Acidobacteriia bacterium]|nr:hypothetical protein [Terriglobia bacterium]